MLLLQFLVFNAKKMIGKTFGKSMVVFLKEIVFKETLNKANIQTRVRHFNV